MLSEQSYTIWAECESFNDFVIGNLKDELSFVADTIELNEVVKGDEG